MAISPSTMSSLTGSAVVFGGALAATAVIVVLHRRDTDPAIGRRQGGLPPRSGKKDTKDRAGAIR
jgi:hypothetical protein